MTRRPDRRRSRLASSRARADAARSGPASSLSAAAVRAQSRRTPAASRWRFPAAVAAATVLFLAGWYAAGPLWPDGPQPVWLAVTAAVSAGAGWLAWRWRTEVSARARRWTVAPAAGLCLLFIVGSLSSVVVDGRVVLRGSETDRAWRMVNDIRDDLQLLAEADLLLVADQAEARARITEYEPATLVLTEVAADYQQLEASGAFPSDQFLPVIRQVQTAADFGARALDGKYNVTLQPDERLAATVASWRQTYVEAVLTAGAQLSDLAGLYGFDLVDPDHDPVE